MKRQTLKKGKVFVAMSGGVDSSVAAALLKKKGYSVTGVFMRPWSPVDNRLAMSVIHSDIRCQWQQDREDAMHVAAQIGIPLFTWDFSREYKKEVADYMLREYKMGRTPNPDVMCNHRIKFGVFLKRALENGADYIATGHYVRLMRKSQIPNPKLQINSTRPRPSRDEVGKFKTINYKLLKAKDKNKDQSYFLWMLTQEQLKHCLFPIGSYTKPEVRKVAKKFSLSTAGKKDSQGVCFIGPLDMKEFLKNYIKPKKGKILDMNGSPVGFHDGVFYYTVGQRHGLGIGNGRGPYFVIKKDVKKNIIYVGRENNLKKKIAQIVNINWVNSNIMPHSFSDKGHFLIDAKTRYRSRSEKAILYKNGNLKFKKPVKAITPGQSAVFYRNNELIGGGIIS